MKNLGSFFQKHYPGCKLEMFGSSMNGFATECSDMDLTLVFPEGSKEEDTFKCGSNRAKAKASFLLQCFSFSNCPFIQFPFLPFQLLSEITGVLIRNKRKIGIKDIESVHRARVKIVKFVSYKYLFSVDLSFINHLVS